MAKMLRGGRRNGEAGRGGEIRSLVLFVSALALGALGQWLVWQPYTPTSWAHQVPGWLLFLAGGFLLHRAFQRSGGRSKSERLPFALEAGLLAAVMVLALFLRLHDLKQFPPGGFRDEGENGNVAIQLMNGEIVDGTDQYCPVYVEQNTQNAAGYFYPVSLSFKFLGISITSERYVSVFFGVLSVAAFWALARWCFGPLLGIFLTACLAALRWHVNFSRIGFLGIMTVFLSLPMLLWLYRGLRAPAPAVRGRKENQLLFCLALGLAVARGWLGFFMDPGAAEVGLGLCLGLPLLYYAVRAFKDERSRWFMLSATALALAMYSYIAARLFVVLVGLIVAHHLLTQQRAVKARVWWNLGACLAVCVLGAAILVMGSAASVSNAAWAESASRKVGLAIVALGALGLVRFWWVQRDLFTGWLRPLGLALGVGLVVAGPLYSYAIAHQKEVAARSYRVSIFNDQDADQRPWGIRLLQNVGPNLGMVNVRGDENPRHNLPNALMVDPVWAALFALGAIYALFNLGDPRAWLALSLWQISLFAGYASMEAPQSYRCISAIPAVLLFMGLALEPGLEPLKRWFKRDGVLAAGLLLLPILLLGGGLEIYTYFHLQAHDPAVWAHFSTDEYEMGQDLKALNSDGRHTLGLVRSDWADSYTFRFMTYPERNYEYYDLSNDLPLRPPESTSGQDIVYILGEDSLPLVDVLRGFYPHGIYKEVRHPFTNELLYWTYWVSAAEAAHARPLNNGLHAVYYEDEKVDRFHPDLARHWTGKKAIDRVDPLILFNWTVRPILGYFSAQWTGSLKAPSNGDYDFVLICDTYGQLEIDGKKVVDRPYPDTEDRHEGKIHLSAGRHRLSLRVYEARPYSRLELWWAPPHEDLQVLPTSVLSPR